MNYLNFYIKFKKSRIWSTFLSNKFKQKQEKKGRIKSLNIVPVEIFLQNKTKVGSDIILNFFLAFKISTYELTNCVK